MKQIACYNVDACSPEQVTNDVADDAYKYCYDKTLGANLIDKQD